MRLYRTSPLIQPASCNSTTDAVPAYCVAVQRFGNSANVSQLNVSRPDTRGGFVPGIGELTLTVDADPPTVMLTAPAVDNVYYKGSSGIPEIITIEGAAIDTDLVCQQG